MAKELCPNCNAKITDQVSFCPVCSRTTPHASETERLEWDLAQWRSHVDRSVASGGTVTKVARRTATSGPPRTVTPAPPANEGTREKPAAPRKPVKASRTPRMRRLPKPRLRLPKPRLRLTAIRPAHEEDRVIVLDADHEFVYTSCTCCERADWIVRTGRNEDKSYNYWCVRCSRSFKTDARLRHGLKPFVAAGSVVGTIAAFSLVLS